MTNDPRRLPQRPRPKAEPVAEPEEVLLDETERAEEVEMEPATGDPFEVRHSWMGHLLKVVPIGDTRVQVLEPEARKGEVLVNWHLHFNRV